jgi:Ca2+-transporting ATPase
LKRALEELAAQHDQESPPAARVSASAPPASRSHALALGDLLTLPGVATSGLCSAKAAARRRRGGPNEIVDVTARTDLDILAAQFKSVPVALLAGAGAFTLGTRAHADARVIDTHRLSANEAPLTGESLPVCKEPLDALDAETVLANRCNMVHMGTTVSTGTGRAMAEAADAPRTRLQQELDGLGRRRGSYWRQANRMAAWIFATSSSTQGRSAP